MRITNDFKAFINGGSYGKAVATILFNPNFHSICLFRLSSFFNKIHLSIISKILWYLNRLLFHVDIDYRADLAGGFVMIHGLGTVIGRSVCSKGKLTIYQGVTIGGNNGKTRVDNNGKIWGQPLIEDNVIIYTNACVFGPIVISRDMVIKAGSIITHDV